MKLNFITRNFLVKQINKNKCFFIPTDTICGLICKDKNVIYDIKKRPKEKSIIKFIDSKEKIDNLTQKEIELLNKFWPGELTIIKSSISYRIPNNKQLISLLKKTGPLYCSSANISNQEVVNNWKKAKKIFGKKIYYITNKFNGSLNPSTILNLDNLLIIREGVLTDEIKEYIKKIF